MRTSGIVRFVSDRWSLLLCCCFIVQIFLGCNHRSVTNEPKPEVEGQTDLIINKNEERLLEYYMTTRYDEREFHGVQLSSEVTFKQIKPLFVEHCVPCHNGSGLAPFSFASYLEIKKRASPILESLSTMLMPPWPADLSYNRYCNEQVIPDSVRGQMIRWIELGMPLGEVSPESKLTYTRVSPPNWIIPPKDKHTITTDSNSYACFVFDPELEKDTFTRTIEFFSDNPETLHHLTLFIDTTGILDTKPDCWVCTHDGTVSRLQLIEGWVKGLKPVVFNENVGYRIPKGSKFLLQAHYENDFKGELEGTSLGFHFVEKPMVEVEWLGLNKFDILFPANKIVAETMSYTLDHPMNIIGFGPHLHYVCKLLEVYAITPDAKKIPFVFIPKWDYLLQTKYILANPVQLPAGSTIYATAVFDNTEDNPVQPNDPIRDVVYDISENDEMFVLTIFYSRNLNNQNSECVASFIK